MGRALKAVEAPIQAKIEESPEPTFQTDLRYRRVVATAEDAHRYYTTYRAPSELGQRLEVPYGSLHVHIEPAAITKMYGWVVERSRSFVLEVQGRFLARRAADRLFVDDFVPLASHCQSLAEDSKPESMRSGSVHRIPIDPTKVAIPFHSHVLKSEYQLGPSPGDHDRIFHMKWLYAPRTGKNILYSGVVPFQVEVPTPCPSHPDLDPSSDEPPNPDDCELWVFDPCGDKARYPIPSGGVTIGRAEECEVVVDDPNVSRVHARIFWSELGQLIFEDLDSRNGSTRGEERIERIAIDSPTDLTVAATKMRVVF
jgi:hypothetical protein